MFQEGAPRRYRGKDANWWPARLGLNDRTVSDLPSPKARFSGKPHISGTRGGHTLNLHQFARDGVVLLHENLAAADRFEADFVRLFDAYIARTGMIAPAETFPVLRDGFEQPGYAELDLKAAGITNVIWATGYRFDFSMIKLPLVDGDGFPLQQRGVTAFQGLSTWGCPGCIRRSQACSTASARTQPTSRNKLRLGSILKTLRAKTQR